MKLKELRKENKKNQTEIALSLHLSQQTYAKYELGQLEPSIDTLCKLADYYGVSLDYLVGRDFANEFIYLSDFEKTIIEQTRKLNEINKVRLLAEIQGMLIVQD